MQPLETNISTMKKNLELKEGFPQRYAAFLEKFELNPNKLASRLNDPARVKYHKYKTGESEPNSTSLFQIASEFPVSIDWLILGQGPMIRGEVGDAPIYKGVEPQDEVGHREPETPPTDYPIKRIIELEVTNEFQQRRIAELEQMVEYLKKDKDQLYSIIPPTGERMHAGSFLETDSFPRNFPTSSEKVFESDVAMVNSLPALLNQVMAKA